MWWAIVVCGILSVVFLALSIAFALHLRRTSRRLSTMARTPTSRIATAPTTGIVEIVGIVRTPVRGALVAPLTGLPCVYYHLHIDDTSGSTPSTLVDDEFFREFHVDDGSGALARVDGERIFVERATRVAHDSHANAVEAILASRKIAAEMKHVGWFEERIDVGATVYVLGQAHPAPTDVVAGYRAPIERLVVLPAAGGELLVALGSEAELAAKLRHQLSNGRALTATFSGLTFLCIIVAIALVVLR